MNHDLPSPDDAFDAWIDVVHTALQRDLANTLPIEKGLTALIGPAPVSRQPDIGSSEFAKVVSWISMLPLRERLVIRPQLPTAALVQAQKIARWLVQAHNIHRLVPGGSSGVRDRTLRLTLDITAHHHLKLDHTLSVAQALKNSLAFRSRTANYELWKLVRSLVHDLNFALNRVVDLDRTKDLVIAGAVKVDLGDPGRMSLFHDFIKLRAYVDGVDVLVRAVDNVEGADLTEIKLGDLDLTGVRWSEFTTRWPPEWEESIRRASACIDQARGLWEIRDDPRIHDHRDTEVSV